MMSQASEYRANTTTKATRQVPLHLFAGLVLIAVWWTIAWYGSGIIRELYFFPLWLGFILTVDALSVIRTGTSLLTRSGRSFAWLFVVSVPLWWLFEGINLRLQNWEYLGAEGVSGFSYAWRASFAFSTVVPAVCCATELVTSFDKNPLRRIPRWSLGQRGLIIAHVAGWVMLGAMLAWPEYLFPVCWLALLFIVDPIVNLLGGWSISGSVSRGDWSPVWNAGIGGLICGFFWELWNLNAEPKWVYVVPHVDFGHIFEMPLLGYGGYIPFALEVVAFVALVGVIVPWISIPLPRRSSRSARASN